MFNEIYSIFEAKDILDYSPQEIEEIKRRKDAFYSEFKTLFGEQYTEVDISSLYDHGSDRYRVWLKSGKTIDARELQDLGKRYQLVTRIAHRDKQKANVKLTFNLEPIEMQI